MRWPFRLAGDGVLRKLRYWFSACHMERAIGPMREESRDRMVRRGCPRRRDENPATPSSYAAPMCGTASSTVCASDTLMPVIDWLPNVPFYYFVLLRETGSAYYVASHDHVPGAAAYPMMRPIAINAASTGKSLYPGLHQGMAGESGFTAETVLYHAHVARYAALSAWYGTAHMLPIRLTGEGRLAGSASEAGAEWRPLAGDPTRSVDGARAGAGFSMACLAADTPAGLIHAVVTIPEGNGKAGIVWRLADAGNYLCLSLSRHGCEIAMAAGGEHTALQSCSLAEAGAHQPMSAQICDYGNRVDVSVNGYPVLQITPPSKAHPAGYGVGILFDAPEGASPCIRDLEAHPRAVDLPAGLPFAPPWSKDGAVRGHSRRLRGAAR